MLNIVLKIHLLAYTKLYPFLLRIVKLRKSIGFGKFWVKKVGKLLISHRYNRLPLLPSGPGGIQQELVV